MLRQIGCGNGGGSVPPGAPVGVILYGLQGFLGFEFKSPPLPCRVTDTAWAEPRAQRWRQLLTHERVGSFCGFGYDRRLCGGLRRWGRIVRRHDRRSQQSTSKHQQNRLFHAKPHQLRKANLRLNELYRNNTAVQHSVRDFMAQALLASGRALTSRIMPSPSRPCLRQSRNNRGASAFRLR